MNFRPIVTSVWKWTKRHSTKLLAAGAIVSQMLGYYFMHKEAPIVRDRLEALGEDADWKDKFKAAGPVYLPAAGMLLLSCGCIIGGCAIGERRTAIVTGMLSASEAALRRTEQEMVKAIGPEKAEEIHRAVADDILRDNPVRAENVELTGKGEVLFFDPLCHRYFRSSVEAVKQDMVDFKDYILNKCYGSVNTLYGYLGIDDAKLGEFHGWTIDKKFEYFLEEGHIDNTMELCWVIRYIGGPVLYNGKEPKSFNECENCYID